MLGRLFVYGSLRSEGRAFERLLGADVASMEPAVLVGYALYGLRLPYPFVRPEAGAQVVGEMVELIAGREPAVLARLDRYEGDQYRRVVCSVDTLEGGPVDAWVYRAAETVQLLPRHRIDTGDWSDPR